MLVLNWESGWTLGNDEDINSLGEYIDWWCKQIGSVCMNSKTPSHVPNKVTHKNKCCPEMWNDTIRRIAVGPI